MMNLFFIVMPVDHAMIRHCTTLNIIASFSASSLKNKTKHICINTSNRHEWAVVFIDLVNMFM